MQAPTSYVECQVHVEARPETVFSYFTDPSRMVRWKGVAARLDHGPDLRRRRWYSDSARPRPEGNPIGCVETLAKQ
jgi:uncharacterized protein YndB with AHSA1/START domain